MEIPYQKLSQDVLHGIIQEFVLREGTDYGEQEYSLEDKMTQVLMQLKQGELVIVFNSKDETCNIIKNVFAN